MRRIERLQRCYNTKFYAQGRRAKSDMDVISKLFIWNGRLPFENDSRKVIDSNSHIIQLQHLRLRENMTE